MFVYVDPTLSVYLGIVLLLQKALRWRSLSVLIDSQVETTENLMSDEEEDAEAKADESDDNDQDATQVLQLSATVAGNASVADSFS